MGVSLPAGYKPSEDEPFMNKRQKEYFRRKLMQWKDDILRESQMTLQHLQEDTVAEPDLADRASTETERALELRTRDRQRKLISKIDAALRRIDDGSYGYHGFVTGQLKDLIDSGKKIDFVLAIGPIPMMKAVAEVTRPYGIKTVVSLNPVMVDGTGMCGGCRAVVGGKTVFVCVDGPEFDAHEVDFPLLMKRNNTYRHEEHDALERHVCNIDKQYAEAVNRN